MGPPCTWTCRSHAGSVSLVTRSRPATMSVFSALYSDICRSETDRRCLLFDSTTVVSFRCVFICGVRYSHPPTSWFLMTMLEQSARFAINPGSVVTLQKASFVSDGATSSGNAAGTNTDGECQCEL